MKKIKFSILILLVSFGCASQKSIYDFPEGMREEVRAVNIAEAEKGRVLYAMNCAKCHNREVKGKTVIPDFSSEQLSNYEFRIANENHEENLSETRLSSDELIQIITFLTYKKKSNYVFEGQKKGPIH